MSPSTPNSHSPRHQNAHNHISAGSLPSPFTPSTISESSAASSTQAPWTPITPSSLSALGRIDSATSLITASSPSLDASPTFTRASSLVDMASLPSSMSSTLAFSMTPSGSNNANSSISPVPSMNASGAPPTPPLYRRRRMRFPLTVTSSSPNSTASAQSASSASAVTESTTINRQPSAATVSSASTTPYASRLSTAAANAAAAYAASLVMAQEQAGAVTAQAPPSISLRSTVSSSLSFDSIRQSQAVTPPTQIIHWTSLLPFGHPNRTALPTNGPGLTGQYAAAAAAAAALFNNSGDVGQQSQQPNASGLSAPTTTSSALQRLQSFAHPSFQLGRSSTTTSNSISRSSAQPLSTSTNSTFNRPSTNSSLSSTSVPPVISPAQTHPQFRTKPVCHLACRHCLRLVSNRAMKAVLLADTRVELFSTDLPLKGAVALVNDTYVTANCKCHIRDIACLGCGNCIGYHVTQPCTSCIAACNNGQRTMLTDAVSVDRKHPTTGADVVWGQLPSVTSLRDLQMHRTVAADRRGDARTSAAPAGSDWVIVNHPMSSALVGVGDTSAMSDGELRDAVIVENQDWAGYEEAAGDSQDDDEQRGVRKRNTMGIMGGWIVKGEACDVQTVGCEHFVGQR